MKDDWLHNQPSPLDSEIEKYYLEFLQFRNTPGTSLDDFDHPLNSDSVLGDGSSTDAEAESSEEDSASSVPSDEEGSGDEVSLLRKPKSRGWGLARAAVKAVDLMSKRGGRGRKVRGNRSDGRWSMRERHHERL